MGLMRFISRVLHVYRAVCDYSVATWLITVNTVGSLCVMAVVSCCPSDECSSSAGYREGSYTV